MNKEFRTRFAPSPSGPPHLGTLHTALFAWLAAKNTGGTFVLRIDDTDAARSTSEWEAEILEALKYLGLDWDEGVDIGGRYSPYRQSERIIGYECAIDRLKAENFLYPCFCTENDLNIQRAAARASGRPFIYDGRCRKLEESDSCGQITAGDGHVWRFHVDPARLGETVEFNDLVWGHQQFQTALIGDFVCMRGDGKPTYMFTSPLDDAAMKISHVIRGSDHLPNTPAQILLMRALGHEPPLYAHLPLITGVGGKKLSKRDSLAGLEEIKRNLPEALINHLALLGWTHPEGKEILSRDELISAFGFNRISTSPAAHDPARLAFLEREHLRKMNPEQIVSSYKNSIYGGSLKLDIESGQALNGLLSAVRDEITSLEAISNDVIPLLNRPDIGLIKDELLKLDPAKILPALDALLVCCPEDWIPRIETLAHENGKKETYMPIRLALSGQHRGFELRKLLKGLSVDEIVWRVAAAKEIIINR